MRSLIVPGAGLYDQRHWLLGAALTVAAIAATIAWLKWGMDWTVVVVVAGSMAWSAALAYDDHPAQAIRAFRPTAAAHEFPLVVLVMAGLSWLKLAWRRTPIGRRRAATAVRRLPLLDECRTASIAALADDDTTTPLDDPAVDVDALRRRSHRVGVAARGRFTGDPLRTDHAHARALLALHGLLEEHELDRFRSDAQRAVLGVPASEPGWVRLLDGTIAAVALQRAGDVAAGDRWSTALAGPFQLRHGHRPAAVWTPLGLRGPRGATWEHAAAAGIARAHGWIADDADWQALRTRSLAAAARGNSVPDDERLVAAGRLLLRFVDDEQAARILGRVTVHRDPLAVALDALAATLVPDSTRRTR